MWNKSDERLYGSKSDESRRDVNGEDPIVRIDSHGYLGSLGNWCTSDELVAVQGFLYRVRGCLEPTFLEVSLCNCYRHSGLDVFLNVFFAARIQSSSAGRLEDAPS